MTQSPSPNSTISHYRIVSKIGAGGMGEVYLAEDTTLDRQVALKILPQEFAQDTDRMNRFVREAKSASALNQPNIITIYEISETDGTHFIASEYIQGETLHTLLQQSSLDLKTTLDVAIQIASALNAAHRAGIIHRDIKPENVMIRPDGLVKILDFGIAKLSAKKAGPTDEDAATALKQQGTSPGVIIGTANYMSPEQARGKDVSAQSDIFSFGIVLYEMVTGQRAFKGENALDIIGAILHTEPTPLNQLSPELPHEIERIINKTLRKDPEARYQTAGDLLTDLKDAKQDLEFRDKLEHSVAPKSHEQKTQTIIPPSTDAPREVQSSTSSLEYAVTQAKSHKLAAGIVALVLLGLISTAGYLAFVSKRGSTDQISSLAVMPFVNEGGNAELEYLSDGMTETLIKSLSQLPNLNVKARSSVFRYKGKVTDSKTIGTELGVQAILNGRIVQRGDRLALSLELIDAQTENVLWSEQYNRGQTDLINLQSEIAKDVSAKLKSKLSGADEAKVAKTYTANPEAYQLYLKGRFVWNKRTGESLKQAIEFYNQAIEKDPNYALAYSGLAETYVLFSSYSVALAKDSMPQAKASAQRALALDESLAEAHTALAEYLNHYEFDRVGAEREFRRAIELNPNYATAHQWFGNHLTALRRFDEALAVLRRAEELDPLSTIIGSNLGDALLYARRYDESLAHLKRVLSLNPDFAVAHFSLGSSYAAKGMYPEAIAELRKYLEIDPDPTGKGYLGLYLAKSGRRDEALKVLSELKQESTQRYVQSIALAYVYLGLGQKEEAYVWLEREISERAANARYFGVLIELDELRSEPRFKEMLKRLNLPE